MKNKRPEKPRTADWQNKSLKGMSTSMSEAAARRIALMQSEIAKVVS